MNENYNTMLAAANAVRNGNDNAEVSAIAKTLKARAKALVAERKEMCKFIKEMLITIPITCVNYRGSSWTEYGWNGTNLSVSIFPNDKDYTEWSGCSELTLGVRVATCGSDELITDNYGTLDELIEKKSELDVYEMENKRVDKAILEVLTVYRNYEAERNRKLAELTEGAANPHITKITLEITKA